MKIYSCTNESQNKKPKEWIILFQGSDPIYESEFDWKANSLDGIREYIDSIT